MLATPIDNFLQRIIDSMEQAILPEVSNPFARGQVAGIVNLLQNLLGKLEERCYLLREENEAMRGLLARATKVLGGEAPALCREIDQMLTREYSSVQPLLEENRDLEGLLVSLVRLLEGEGTEEVLPDSPVGKMRTEVRKHLRAQLNKELSLASIALFGKMSKGD